MEMKVELSKREVNKNKKLAAQYKGISYRADENVFVVRVRIGTDLKGKPIYFLPTRRYTDFNKALNRWYEVAALIKKGISEQGKFTFRELHNIVLKYIESSKGNQMVRVRGTALNTIRQYNTPLNVMERIAPAIYDKSIDEVTQEEISEFLKLWAQTVTSRVKSEPPSAQQVNKQFSGIWNLLKSETYTDIQTILNKRKIDIKKCKDVFKTKLTVTTTRTIGEGYKELIYNYDEVKKLWAEVNKKDVHMRKNAMPAAKLCFKVQIVTGTRVSEVVGLLKSDIVKKPLYEGGYCLKIYKQKQGKGAMANTKTSDSDRLIPIPEEIYRELLEYADENSVNDNDYIFSRWNKAQQKVDDYNTNTLTKLLEKVENLAGVQHIDDRASHGFRHTIITYFGKSGAGVERSVLNKFCGHKNDDSSTEEKIYESKKPTSIDFISFIAAQRAYVDCLTNNKYFEELPELYSKYLEQVKFEVAVERGAVNVYEEQRKAVPRILQDTSAAKKMLYLIEKSEKAEMRKAFYSLPRKQREGINADDYVEAQFKCWQEFQKQQMEKDKNVEQKELLEGKFKGTNKIPYWLMEEVADTEQYAEYYYNTAMDEVYRENNSFDDFMADVRDGFIKLDFNADVTVRADIQTIKSFALKMANSPKLYEQLKKL